MLPELGERVGKEFRTGEVAHKKHLFHPEDAAQFHAEHAAEVHPQLHPGGFRIGPVTVGAALRHEVEVPGGGVELPPVDLQRAGAPFDVFDHGEIGGFAFDPVAAVTVAHPRQPELEGGVGGKRRRQNELFAHLISA